MWRVLNFVRILLIAIMTVFCSTAGTVLTIITFSPNLSAKLMPRLWSGFILRVSGVKLIITGREHVDVARPSIYVSNHESQMDIPALFYALWIPSFFIAKKEIRRIPFMGWYMILAGMIFVDRKNSESARQSMKAAAKKIQNGKSVISFPEGTRNRDGKMLLFKRGTFVIAKEGNIPIVPISIKGAREVVAPGEFRIKPGTVFLNIGKPIYPGDHPELKEDQLANFVREEVIRLRAT
jgi:1-acyl-sn-glycerol-3-phosphate acyltransferase